MRKLPVTAYLLLVALYLGLIQGVSAWVRQPGSEYGRFFTIEQMQRELWLPVGLSLLLVVVAVSALRAWPAVLRDDRPVRPWLRVVPAMLLLTVAIGLPYSRLPQLGEYYVLALLLGTLMVGAAEELMYRGLGVVVFRANGFREGQVALWVSVIFGLSHSTNVFAEGSAALLQALVTVVAGVFFYLVRRSSGGLLLPALVHGLWDFGLLACNAGPPGTPPYAGSLLFLGTNLLLAIVLLVGRHRIESPAAAATT